MRNTLFMFCQLFVWQVWAQSSGQPIPKDFAPFVQPLYNGEESTALSIFDTNPESPDGKHVILVRYKKIVQGGHEGPEVMAELMVKNRITHVLKKITDVEVTNHNGSNAFWLNNTLLATQVEHLQSFEVFDVATGQSVFGKIEGELGHKASSGKIFFSRCNGRKLANHPNRKPYTSSEEGIWCLHSSNGALQKIVSKTTIIDAFTAQNPNITGNDVQLLHVDPNTKGDKILFDYRHKKVPASARHEQLQGFVEANGNNSRWIPKRPMHVVWYDNATMMGVDTEDPEKKVFKYDLYGKELALLAGPACHLGAAPNRQWYAGEGGYYKPEPDGFTRVYLYEKGNPTPIGLLASWKNAKITWTWVAHVNPSFSADNKRLYFIRAVENQEKFEAVFVDLEAAGVLQPGGE